MTNHNKKLANQFSKLDTSNNQEPVVNVPVVNEGNKDEKLDAFLDVLGQGFKEEFKAKQERQTVDDTHKRATFLFRRDLEKRLDKLAKGKRGFKTMFINRAIEILLDGME